MDEQLKSNLTSAKHWIRLVFMILFAIALQAASFVMTVLVVVQFLFALITGSDNLQLRKFGDALSIFIFQTLQFLIYNREEKPFPFSDWPVSKVEVDSVEDQEGDVELDTESSAGENQEEITTSEEVSAENDSEEEKSSKRANAKATPSNKEDDAKAVVED